MITVETILEFLNGYCPFETAMETDNPGLQVGARGAAVSRVLLDMDATAEAAEEAAARGCELLITHHPLSFGLPKNCTDETTEGRGVLRLARHGIAHIACHTNLDAAANGVNTQLAAACGMKETVLFAGIARAGSLETTAEELAARVKRELHVAACRAAISHPDVHKLAVIGGSGGSMVEECVKEGCDTLVTGEAKHRQILLARELGLNLLIFGHYETEYPVLPPLAEALRAAFPELEVAVRRFAPPTEVL